MSLQESSLLDALQEVYKRAQEYCYNSSRFEADNLFQDALKSAVDAVTKIYDARDPKKSVASIEKTDLDIF